jgi:hypothetical protein
MFITVNPTLEATAPTLETGIVGEAYPTLQLTATGGGGNYLWSSNDLPAGMTLSADGVLAGTPLVAGPSDFSVTVVSDDGQSTTLFLSFQVEQPPLQITSTSPLTAVAGNLFSATLEAVGGGGGYSWTMDGTLPTGLGWADGTISGTAQQQETVTITVGVTSQDGQTTTKDFEIRVVDQNAPLTVETPSTPGGERGIYYSTQLEASGGDRNYTWSLAPGEELPPGLTLASDGTISGTPTLAGSYTFTVEVQAGYGGTVPATYTIEILDPALEMQTTELPEGHLIGTDYPPVELMATGGNEVYHWEIVGSLPPGLALVDGVIFGVPTVPGSYTFSVQVTSGEGDYAQVVTREFIIFLDHPILKILTESFHSGYTFLDYEPIILEAQGGDGSYAWTITSGALHNGLVLQDGVISGTPQESGRKYMTVQVTSGASPFDQTDSKEFSISIALGNPLDVSECYDGGYVPFRFYTEEQCVRYFEEGLDSRIGEYPDLVMDPYTVTPGQTMVPYAPITFTATGGADDGPDASYYEWTSQDLPEWLNLDLSTGELTGTPLFAGDYTFDVTVTSFRDEQTATTTVTIPVTWSDPTAAAQCTEGNHIYYGFVTETQCTRYVDTGMDSREGEYPELIITTSEIPNGRPGELYDVTFTATGGEDNPDSYYLWTMDNLPAGLTFDESTGQLEGTPEADGDYPFTVSVTSYFDLQTAFQTFTLKVTTDPETAEDCKKGGYLDYGFDTQGLCIQFVNTGFDSRLGDPSGNKKTKGG